MQDITELPRIFFPNQDGLAYNLKSNRNISKDSEVKLSMAHLGKEKQTSITTVNRFFKRADESRLIQGDNGRAQRTPDGRRGQSVPTVYTYAGE